MMTALVQHPDQLAETRDWYNARLDGLDLSQAPDRRLALAFLAGEGAFLLKAFGLMDIDEAVWKALFADLLEITQGDAARDEES